MGNPHCVVFVATKPSSPLEDSEFARVGRQFEQPSVLPPPRQHRFILPLSRDRLRMPGVGARIRRRHWHANGACAALVAAVLTGASRARRRWNCVRKAGIEWRERARAQQIM